MAGTMARDPADHIPSDNERGRLLVVDDNEMNRDMLSRRLAKRGHEVAVAEDGHQALEMVREHEFDVVLLDIMMPGIDGYDVLERLRQDHAAGDLPVIMATAKDESRDIVQALKLGANDYVTKPFDFPVVLARVNTQLSLKRSRQALAEAHRRMKRDLEAAARIQQAFLPTAIPEVQGVRFAWRYVPCDELAGDTLNIIPLDDHQVAVYVLDVSGHGVPSSLLSVTLSRLMTRGAESDSILWNEANDQSASPVDVAEELARRFPYDMETGQYFTLAYGVLDVPGRELTYVSAGHVPIIRVRPGARPNIYETTGPPVGLIPASIMPSEFEQVTISLQPGDRLYFYSDGIPEATDSDDEQFGEERLADTLDRLVDTPLEDSLPALVDAARAWSGGTAFDDDVTILAVEIVK
jgi:sigma-B regulation protein RsbU (phosphoserine phosphatase)